MLFVVAAEVGLAWRSLAATISRATDPPEIVMARDAGRISGGRSGPSGTKFETRPGVERLSKLLDR